MTCLQNVGNNNDILSSAALDGKTSQAAYLSTGEHEMAAMCAHVTPCLPLNFSRKQSV